MISFSVEYPQRPWTLNAERASNRWERAKRTREWRLAFQLLTAQMRMPQLAECSIEVEPWLLNRRSMQDTAACVPAAKAAIDGLVDAGLILDDTPDIVKTITFHAPQIGRNGLVLIISGEPK